MKELFKTWALELLMLGCVALFFTAMLIGVQLTFNHTEHMSILGYHEEQCIGSNSTIWKKD